MSQKYENDPSPEFQEMVEANEWHHNLDEVMSVIKGLLAKGSGWAWPRNTRCKYVGVRIDMRDGGFVLLDREGERISLEQLKWQYRSEEERP